MARPNQEAIDTFIGVTGSTEAVAIQRLEEHRGDLNAAINAHFSEGDRNAAPEAPAMAPENDFMDIDDDPLDIMPRGPMSAALRGLNPFSLLEPNFRGNLLDTRSLLDNSSGILDRAPSVTYPREVRQIPIEVKDENRYSGPSRHGPIIEDVTDTEHGQGPEIRGAVVIDDEDEDNIPTAPARGIDRNEWGDPVSYGHRAPSAPDFHVPSDYGNDIEEEMIRAAIEASKKDAEFQHQQVGAENVYDNTQSKLKDPELEQAVSLSLKTAEQEKALREHIGKTGASGSRERKPLLVEELEEKTESNGRQVLSSFEESAAPHTRKEVGSSSAPDEVEEVEEQPLVRHRSRRMPSNSVDARRKLEGVEFSPALSPPVDPAASHPPVNGDAFPAEEWGGISSEEHDEAVMLEAAMFGGIPEQTGYQFPYAPHQFMLPDTNRVRQAHRPPSPGLAAQRLIREQQDDAYHASLQADKEKELKAIEEERAARQAALEEQKRKEEESRRKLEEEQELERLLAAKEASLPEEPPGDDENTVNLLVRMPDGTRRGRRFLKTHRLQFLFDFIDIGRGVKPGTYRVVRPFPRRPFSDGESNMTLSELGLTSKQEALFLELI